MSQDAITTALSGKASVSTYSATLLSSGWSGNSAPYTQTVSVSGILSTDNTFAYVILSNDTSTAVNESDQWGFVSQMTTSNGFITAKCLEFKPNIDLNISLIAIRWYYMARIILQNKISQTVASLIDRSIKYKYYGITQIGDHAFSQCYKLLSVIIPDSITHIGNQAFLYVYFP